MRRSVRSLSGSAHTTVDALGWSARQGRILSGGGRAEGLYTEERGFPFSLRQLPHHHLLHGTTHHKFRDWLKTGRTCDSLVGVWSRPLFTGGWEHSTDADERVFNVQTRALFVDLRVPTSRPSFDGAASVDALGADSLRLLARQHVFCGYTLPDTPVPHLPMVCTRHHAIDWNFVGTKRALPNKWRVELGPAAAGAGSDAAAQWKEWAFALDDDQQSYYMERWARVDGDGLGAGPTLALRSCGGRDAFILLVGDHFAFARARVGCALVPPKAASLVELVDTAVACGDLAEARAWLGLAGGHGRVADGWTIDLSTHPWLEGTQLLRPGSVTGAFIGGQTVGQVCANPRMTALAHGVDDFVIIDGAAWEVLDRTGLPTADAVIAALAVGSA
jgi:hypothetical protein